MNTYYNDNSEQDEHIVDNEENSKIDLRKGGVSIEMPQNLQTKRSSFLMMKGDNRPPDLNTQIKESCNITPDNDKLVRGESKIDYEKNTDLS